MSWHVGISSEFSGDAAYLDVNSVGSWHLLWPGEHDDLDEVYCVNPALIDVICSHDQLV